MPESSKKARRHRHRRRPAVVDLSIEKDNKRVVSVDDIVRLVSMTTVDDPCGGGKNKLDTMKQDIGEENNEESKPSSKKQSVAKKYDEDVDPKIKNFLRFKDFTPESPFPPLPGGTKLVFMDNLHPDIKETDVIDFFKDDGKIDEVTFLDTKFFGCGDVRFETSEAAEKALKRNGEVLIDRPVRLIASDDRTIFDFYTPTEEETYLFMGNLSLSVKEDDIVQLFKDDGNVSIHLMSEEYPFDGDKLVAHVKFASSAVAYKAYQQRYGQMLHGRRVEFALATEKTVWYSSTPSSSKPPQGPGWGTLSGPCCSRCMKNLGI